MLLNYLKLAFRLLLRNPFFTFINVVGLSIGFASFFVLWQYATSELRTDQYHKDFDRTARIGTNWRWTDDGGENWGLMVFGISKSTLPSLIKEDYDEVDSYVRILGQGGFWQQGGLAPHGDKILVTSTAADGTKRIFKETRLAYADSNLFEFFTIPLLQGDKNNVLSDPNFVALSKSSAIKYFGNRDPLGELLVLNDTITLKVTGIYEDLPYNSHLDFSMVISNKGLLGAWNNAWLAHMRNYIKLKPGATFKELEAKINTQTEKYFEENMRVMKNKFDIFLQPLKDIAFSKSYTGDDFPPRSKNVLLSLVTVSVVILLMAWANYINLSFSRVTKRFKEFATRKANGAHTLDLVKQFMIESVVVNLLAIGVAFTVLQIVRQLLKNYFNIQVHDILSMNMETIIVFSSVILSGILLTGLYPAFVGMANDPQSLFQSNGKPSAKRRFPSILTTIQFSSAIALILWGFIIFLQLNHILNKDTGLSRDGVIVIDAPTLKSRNYNQEIEGFHNEVMRSSLISSATSSWRTVGDLGQGGGDVRKIGTESDIGLDGNGVSESFIPFYGMQLLAGRNFIVNDKRDAVIISRVAVSRLSFKTPEDAVGAKVEIQLNGMKDWEVVEVIGVIKDYRNEPYFNADESHSQYANGGEGRGIVLTYKDELSSHFLPEKIAVKVSTADYKQAITFIEDSFKKYFPADVFAWYFLDDHINQVYGSERITRNQILLFTTLAIIIACLGLIGMMANRINEKTKEIGIRKILGAGGTHLGKILLQTTIQQFIVATSIGLPLAYYLGNQYLQKYSERISLTWWYFAIPIAIFLVIMIASISTMLWRAVRTNPVESLRSE